MKKEKKKKTLTTHFRFRFIQRKLVKAKLYRNQTILYSRNQLNESRMKRCNLNGRVIHNLLLSNLEADWKNHIFGKEKIVKITRL